MNKINSNLQTIQKNKEDLSLNCNDKIIRKNNFISFKRVI